MHETIKMVVTFVGLACSTNLFISGSTMAHEPRVVADGALNVAVGWRTEPAFSKSVNAFDFIVTDAVDVEEPELIVTILYLKEDAPDGKIIKSALLEGELRRDRTNPNRFNISLLPTKAGAYGFHIKGMVNGLMVDEVFICRGGTQNSDGRSFGCIEDPQKFPGGKKSKHNDDD